MTWIDTYESHAMERALQRLREDGILTRDAADRDDERAPKTVTSDEARGDLDRPPGLTRLKKVGPRRAILARLKGDKTPSSPPRS